jgi:hypothetical protein
MHTLWLQNNCIQCDNVHDSAMIQKMYVVSTVLGSIVVGHTYSCVTVSSCTCRPSICSSCAAITCVVVITVFAYKCWCLIAWRRPLTPCTPRCIHVYCVCTTCSCVYTQLCWRIECTSNWLKPCTELHQHHSNTDIQTAATWRTAYNSM